MRGEKLPVPRRRALGEASSARPGGTARALRNAGEAVEVNLLERRHRSHVAAGKDLRSL